MFQIALFYLLKFFMLIAVLFTLGRILTGFIRLENTGRFWKIGLELLLGTMTGVVLYSVITSRLLTANTMLFTLLLFALPLLSRNKQFKLPDQATWNPGNLLGDLFRLYLVALPFFLLACIQLFDFQQNMVNVVQLDVAFWSELIDILRITGNENRAYAANFFPDLIPRNGITAYHYYELWLSALAVSTLKIPASHAYVIFTATLLKINLFVLILSVWELKGRVTGFKIALSFLLTDIFIPPFIKAELFPNLKPIISYFQEHHIHEIRSPKHLPAYLFLLVTANALMRKKYLWAILALSVIPVLNIVTASSILGAMFLGILILAWRKELHWTWAAYPLALFILIFGFFSIFGDSTSESWLSMSLISDWIKDPFNLSYLRTIAVHQVIFGVMTLTFLSPVLLLLALNWRSTRAFRRFLMLAFLIMVNAALSVSLFTGVSDSIQFFTFMLPAIVLIGTLGIIEIWDDLGKIQQALTTIVLFVFMAGSVTAHVFRLNRFDPNLVSYHQMDRASLEAVRNALPNNTKYSRVAELKDGASYREINLSRLMPTLLSNLHFEALVNISSKLTHPERLDPENVIEMDYCLHKEPFWVYAQIERKKGKSDSQIQTEFIKNYGIQYLILPRMDKIPDQFSAMVKDTLWMQANQSVLLSLEY